MYGKIGLYKHNVRQFLEKKYVCMFNAGDQWTDLMPIAPSLPYSKKEYILLQHLKSKGIYLKLPQFY